FRVRSHCARWTLLQVIVTQSIGTLFRLVDSFVGVLPHHLGHSHGTSINLGLPHSFTEDGLVVPHLFLLDIPQHLHKPSISRHLTNATRKLKFINHPTCLHRSP